jgi:predicted ChrR family anti-sigma factor
MSHLDELQLLDHVCGTLDEIEAADVARHLSSCRSCRARVAQTQGDLSALPLALPPLRPPPSLRDRLLTSARHSCADEVGRFFDLPPEDAKALLDAIESDARWEPGPFGAWLFHLKGGPAFADADCGFIKILAGQPFPLHTHRGEERNLIVKGLLIDGSGRVYKRGDVLRYPDASSHTFRAAEGSDLVYATILWDGVVVSGEFLALKKG